MTITGTTEDREIERLQSRSADQAFGLLRTVFTIAPILFVSFLGLVALLSMGYIKKVLLPKYRGKRVE